MKSEKSQFDLPRYYEDLERAATQFDFTFHEMGIVGGVPLVGLTRAGTLRGSSLYLSAGTHGDEPAGPMALLHLLRGGDFPRSLGLCLCPLLNPLGVLAGSRENAQGRDINRDYLELETLEARCHTQWLSRNGAHYSLLAALHEDSEAKGYYLYELNRHGVPSPAPSILGAVKSVVGLDHSSVIEGYPATNSVLHPPLDLEIRPQWPESCYLLAHHGDLVYTFECPTNCSLDARVEAHVTAVKAAMKAIQCRGGE